MIDNESNTSSSNNNNNKTSHSITIDSSPLLVSNTTTNKKWRYCIKRAYLIGMLSRFITTIIILGVLIAIGIGLKYTDSLPKPEDFTHLEFDWQVNPSSYLTPFNQSFKYNVLLDGHAHSTYSDGKMNVKQLLDWHIANGYNAVIVSDHNTLSGGLFAEKLALENDYYRERIVVIPAIEYTCCRIHMNLVGINETIKVGPPVPTDDQLREVIKRTHELGGIVIVNHIPWSNTTQVNYDQPRLPNHPSVADLIAWGVDGFEIINQDTFDYPTMQIAQRHNLIQMIGTDVHHPSVPANAWLTVNSPSMNKTDIMNEIIARRTSFLYDPTGTPYLSYPTTPSLYNFLTPLTWLGDYFGMFYTVDKGMYSFQGTFCHPEKLVVKSAVIGWFIFWSLLLFISFELVFGVASLLFTHLQSYIQKRRSLRIN